MEKLYDYINNTLNYTRRDGKQYLLNLRGKVTVIDGNSGTGKTLLAEELYNLQKSGNELTGVDLSNIVVINSADIKIEDKDVLYIIDRADRFLNKSICDTICDCSKARFLIFARGSYNLGVSPNHFGVFKMDGECITIHYDFDESWW